MPPLATLYYSKNSSGAANYIAAYKAGILDTKLVAYQVDLWNKIVLTGPDQGESFFDINPKGNVPTIILEDDDETVLNENGSCLQWILDNAVNPIGPEFGTKERFLLQTKLSFVSSELHNLVSDIFKPTTSDAAKSYLMTKLKKKLQFLNDEDLKTRPKYFLGHEYTVADSYLHFIIHGCQWVGVDLSAFPNIQEYFNGIAKLPFIAEAEARMESESPIPKPEALGTLYYSDATSCGNYLAAYKAGIINTKLAVCKVDLKNDLIISGPQKGSPFSSVDSKKSLPTIQLKDGTLLNQNASTLQWILENAEESVGFDAKTAERYALQSKLSFVAADLDSVLQDLFNPEVDEAARAFLTVKFREKLKFVNDNELQDGRSFWIGGKYSVADAYLFYVLEYVGVGGVDLGEYPNLKRYFNEMNSLEFIQAAKADMNKN
ncbi:UNVERIFIED_CONTAM: hypothetical protein HDU68_007765 [Siphonaria sp. JEL0065]|nr:hypothetical protein HDU68_007765 [Siphonaria sp. JEL0065]